MAPASSDEMSSLWMLFLGSMGMLYTHGRSVLSEDL